MRLFHIFLLFPLLVASSSVRAQSTAPQSSAPSPSTLLSGNLPQESGGSSPPLVIAAPPPEYSEQARKAKAGGNVLLSLEIDTDGNPRNVRVVRGIGMGLDEKAIEAVHQYRFKPALKNGKPVATAINIEVHFQIADHP